MSDQTQQTATAKARTPAGARGRPLRLLDLPPEFFRALGIDGPITSLHLEAPNVRTPVRLTVGKQARPAPDNHAAPPGALQAPAPDRHQGYELVARHPETLEALFHGQDITLRCYKPWESPKVWEGQYDPSKAATDQADEHRLSVEDRVRLLWGGAATMTATVGGHEYTFRYDRLRCKWVH